MSILFTCPHCGSQTDVDEQFAGQTGPCADCGKQITIPRAISGGKPGGGKTAAVITIVALAGLFFGVVPCFMLFGGLFAFRAAAFAPPPATAVAVAPTSPTINNLQQIGLAMHNYHDTWKSFPPAVTYAADGTPLHSWRVLLLPYLNETSLYSQYKLDEPWDGPNNSQLVGRMPAVYGDPYAAPSQAGKTRCQLIVGQGAAFDRDKRVSMVDIIDGTSTTLMVIQASNTVNWMEPVDLDFTTMSFKVGDPQGNAIGGNEGGISTVLMFDGSTHLLPLFKTPQEVKAMITPNGGEPLLIDF